MSALEIDYCEINNVPMFCSDPYVSEAQKRIYGYKDSKRRGLALYPGFLPMARHVLNDLEVVFGNDLSWTDAALEHRQHIQEAEKAQENLELPDHDLSYILEPYEHQREGIVKAFWEHRVAIFHDCGLGKTKTMIDVLRLLKLTGGFKKTLVLCPSHLVRNWQREVAKHSEEGEFSVRVMVDENNNSLPPETRMEMYAGERNLSPDENWKFYDEYPDLYYEPLPDGLPGDIYKHERAYVEAIVNDDSEERSKARNRMRYRAKKHGFDLPDAGSWRMLDPAPDPVSDSDILVMSYDIAVADYEVLKVAFPFGIIIADESHYLRGYKSERSKTACKLSKRAYRRYLMSGTPSLGDPMHMYKQLQYLSPVLTQGWFRYTRRYLVKAKRNDKMVVGYKNMHVLNDVVSDVSHRRKQEECLDLPDQHFVTIPVEVGAETKRTYNDLVKHWSASLVNNDRYVEVQQAPDRINKLLQVLSGFYIDSNKDAELCDGCPFLMECVRKGHKPYTETCMVETEDPPKETLRLDDNPRLETAAEQITSVMQEPDNKIIVWCTYTEELNMLEERLQQMGLGYVRVDGRTRDKVACEDEFRENPDCRVYLSHVKISEGLTLNSANYVMYYGLTYDLKDYIQSMKRNHRIGQERKVTIFHLVTPGSIHQYILRALDRKKDLAENMTDAIRCGTCEHFEHCDANNIEPFDEDCVYSKSQSRVVTKPATL